jgi:RHS repeat-associated protein
LWDGSQQIFVSVEETFAGTGWHFFAASFDDANNLFKLYIDGELAASTTVTSSISWSGLGSNTVIGRHGNGNTHFDFKGVIDDVGVYDYALTADQVAELYESGPTTQFQYDCNNNLTQVIDPLNRVTEYEYDDLNRLIARKDPDPNTGGITANSPITLYTYNALGWLTSMTDPNENVTFYQYDDMGRRTKEVNVLEPGLTGEYRDYFDELLHTRVDAVLEFPADPDFAGYSDLGDGFSAEWTGAIYLDFGTEPFDEATFYLNNTDYAELYIDDQLVHDNYSYGNMGETYTDVELAAGWHTFTVKFFDQYDQGQSGLIVSYDIGSGQELIPGTALFTTQVTTTTYDAVGRVDSLTDPNGNTTTYVYDDVDRLTSESITIDSVPLTRSFEYDDNGNLIQTTDRNGRVTRYEYDDLNRRKSDRWYTDLAAFQSAPNSPLETINYSYDANGNLLSSGEGDSTYEYVYDYLNRVTDVTQTFADLDPAILFHRGYDAASRLTSSSATVGLTDDYLNTYTYDTLGRLTQLSQTSQSGGNAVTNKRVDFDYNAASQLTVLSRYASLNTASPVADTEYGYDDAGRLISIGHTATATGSTFEETHSYTYDQANRVASYANVYGDFSTDYGYDATDQLTSEDLPGGSVDYTYDSNGNRQSVNSTDYEVGPYNRLLSDGVYDYEYDDEGNLTQKTSIATGNYTVYVWDHRNRLVQVAFYEPGEGNVRGIDYSYDAFNQLIGRAEWYYDGSNEKSVFVHDNGQIMFEFYSQTLGSLPIEELEASDLARRFLWGPAVDQLLAEEDVQSLFYGVGDNTLWALTDQLGSVRDMLDSDGNLRLHRAFDAFGNIDDETYYNADGSEREPYLYGTFGYTAMVFAYTGRLLDETTGLQNNLNRWYDPATGRWISEDPIGFNAGDPNLYRYVGNSPTNFTDPSGLDPVDSGWESERQKIIDGSRTWFKWYQKHGKGFPAEDCDLQAIDAATDPDVKGPWKYWELRGVHGWRWVWPKWPSGYILPMVRENENAIGVFPKGDNPCRPFVIDTFHDYHNKKPDITIYPDIDDFFKVWKHGQSRDAWGPSPSVRWDQQFLIEGMPIIPPGF